MGNLAAFVDIVSGAFASNRKMTNTTWDVAGASELENGKMKEVSAGDKKLLLARVEEKLYAVDGECPHYGAPLAEGLLCGDRVVCPWHKSCFRVTDGNLLEPPALDDLRSYPVELRDGRVFVNIAAEASRPAVTPQTFVIVGAGAAGLSAAETLRKKGFTGRLVLISHEQELPYDRTKLSKEFLSGNAGPDELPMRPVQFYAEHSIERLTGHVSSINSEVKLEDGSQLRFDALLLAPGSVPRTLDVPGAGLGNVFTLRSKKDGQQILEASPPGTRAVVVGGSFIGLEVASCFALRKIPVKVVLPEEVPFEKQLGVEVGRVLKELHESHGVEFVRRAKVSRIEGTGVVQRVVLESGQVVPADIVIVGIGVRPATNMAATLAKTNDGGLVTDRFLNAGGNVYVAGDAAAYPEPRSGEAARIEHWRVAEQQGRVAALNMLGQKQAFDSVPYFWTIHFDTQFEYLGHAKRWDEVIFQPGPKPPAFLAYYIVKGKVVGAAGCQHDLEIAALHELFRLGRELTAADARSNPIAILEESQKQ